MSKWTSWALTEERPKKQAMQILLWSPACGLENATVWTDATVYGRKGVYCHSRGLFFEDACLKGCYWMPLPEHPDEDPRLGGVAVGAASGS